MKQNKYNLPTAHAYSILDAQELDEYEVEEQDVYGPSSVFK